MSSKAFGFATYQPLEQQCLVCYLSTCPRHGEGNPGFGPKSRKMIGEQQMFASHNAFFVGTDYIGKNHEEFMNKKIVYTCLCEIQVVQIRLAMTFVLML